MKYLTYILGLIVCASCINQHAKISNSIIAEYLNTSYNLENNNNFLDSDKITFKEISTIYQRGIINNKARKKEDSTWPFSIDELNEISTNKIYEMAHDSKWQKDELNIPLTLITENSRLADIAMKAFKNKGLIFQLSDVYKNDTESKALLGIGVTSNLNVSEKYVLVFIKKNNKWIVSNKIFDTTLH